MARRYVCCSAIQVPR